ncbi:MAG: zinc-binding dehydrogenase [Candidatus Heimdallarchaeota archaeon]|nr:zinc-binding dehydrogenase [Candidatus Heimdallarchaeota archaeon]MDH5644959.1 zinc-binding dehydrogenase [Candidatus Heimdallarchaeota archaeon]
MKAAILNQHGDPSVFEISDVDIRKIDDFEIKIDVKSFALNHLDLWIRRGNPAWTIPFPHISGTDMAGVVSEIGTKVKGVSIGDRVTVNPGISCLRCKYCRLGQQSMCRTFHILGSGAWGGAAEQVIVPNKNVIKMPDSISFEHGAAAPLTFLTVYRMLRTKAKIMEGEKVLVLGAGGGVGTAAIQLIKEMGGESIALTSTQDKMDKCKEIGATHVLNYRDNEDWDQSVLEITENEGVNIVIDPVGEKTWEKAINTLSKGGRLVSVGATTGPRGITPIRNIFAKQISIFGSYMGTDDEFRAVMSMFFNGKVSPVIDKVYQIEEISSAHARLESGNHFGKIVLNV